MINKSKTRTSYKSIFFLIWSRNNDNDVMKVHNIVDSWRELRLGGNDSNVHGGGDRTQPPFLSYLLII